MNTVHPKLEHAFCSMVSMHRKLTTAFMKLQDMQSQRAGLMLPQSTGDYIWIPMVPPAIATNISIDIRLKILHLVPWVVMNFLYSSSS